MFIQILLAAAMATGGFLFVMIAGNLFRGPLADVMGGRLPMGVFIEFTALLIPSLAPYVLPIGILTGVLLVLGRMSAQNEITAMKAAGIPLHRIAAPVVAVGLIASFAAVFINFEYATWANARGKRLLAESPAALLAEKQLITKFPGYLIYVDSREGSTLHDVWVWRRDKSGRETDFIRAESGVIANLDALTGATSLPVTVRNAVVEQRPPSRAGETSAPPVTCTRLDEVKLEFPMGDLVKASTPGDRKLRQLTFAELMDVREKGWRTTATSTAEEKLAERIAIQLQIQTHLAGAVGILSLTLLAIPLGIRVSRSETFVNFGVALALALSYYLMVVFVSWIKSPVLRPDLLVWLPNLLIQGIAIRLFLKAAKT